MSALTGVGIERGLEFLLGLLHRWCSPFKVDRFSLHYVDLSIVKIAIVVELVALIPRIPHLWVIV